jgi:catechol 2,3-dioxygenase-like lactoylglutathione lyase family enzyme
MLTIGNVVMGVDDFPRGVAFWTEALGYVPRDGVVDDDRWVVLVPAGGRPGPHLALERSETPTQERPRVHLDLYTVDQKAEIERLIGLGASEVDWDLYPEDADFVVLADPEGNRFCVVDRS